MDEIRYLYFIITEGVGSYYVIAKSFDDAVKELKERLDESDYGYRSDREVRSIEIIAEENFWGDKQHFSGPRINLVVPKDSWKWQKNDESHKPLANHSVLLKTVHGVAEGEWKGERNGGWRVYRWSANIADSGVLYWMELSDIEIPQSTGEEQKASYATIVETGEGAITALVKGELPIDGCDDKQKPVDAVVANCTTVGTSAEVGCTVTDVKVNEDAIQYTTDRDIVCN